MNSIRHFVIVYLEVLQVRPDQHVAQRDEVAVLQVLDLDETNSSLQTPAVNASLASILQPYGYWSNFKLYIQP